MNKQKSYEAYGQTFKAPTVAAAKQAAAEWLYTLLNDIDNDPIVSCAEGVAGATVRHTNGWHYSVRHMDCMSVRETGPFRTQDDAARGLRAHIAQLGYDEENPVSSFRDLHVQAEWDEHEKWVRFQMRHRSLSRGSPLAYKDGRIHSLASGDPRIVPFEWEAALIMDADRRLAEIMRTA